MNQFMVRTLFASLILYLPLAQTFGLVSPPVSTALLAIPSQAALLLIQASIDPASVPPWAETYGIAYLSLWAVVGWFWCVSEYRAAVTGSGR